MCTHTPSADVQCSSSSPAWLFALLFGPSTACLAFSASHLVLWGCVWLLNHLLNFTSAFKPFCPQNSWGHNFFFWPSASPPPLPPLVRDPHSATPLQNTRPRSPITPPEPWSENAYVKCGAWISSRRLDATMWGFLYFSETKCINLDQRSLIIIVYAERSRSSHRFHSRGYDRKSPHMIIGTAQPFPQLFHTTSLTLQNLTQY